MVVFGLLQERPLKIYNQFEICQENMILVALDFKPYFYRPKTIDNLS